MQNHFKTADLVECWMNCEDSSPSQSVKHKLDQVKMHTPKGKSTLRARFSVILLTLMALFAPKVAAQTQTKIVYAAASTNDFTASKATELILEMSRDSKSGPWQVNTCFQLFIKNPYSNKDNVYNTFTDQNIPTCTALTNGFTVSCTRLARDTVKFNFSKVDPNVQNCSIKVSGFTNPYSQKTISSINLRQFSDSACLTTPTSIDVSSGIQINAAVMPASNVVLDTYAMLNPGVKRLGYDAPDNNLVVVFKPKTQMDPLGFGQVRIKMPSRWSVGNRSLPFMDTVDGPQNFCTSDCFTVTDQAWQSDTNTMVINYNKMTPSCITGSQIKITCPGFNNPVSKDIWSGFIISTYDSDTQSTPIEISESIALDATQYDWVDIDPTAFVINPTNQDIDSASMWSFSFAIPMPLFQNCQVVIYFPDDLSYSINSVNGFGMFAPKVDGQSVISPSDIKMDTTSTPAKITFNACQNANKLSPTPAGQLQISNINTPQQIKDTGNFFVEIYRGLIVAPEFMVAKTTKGIRLEATLLLPGKLSNFFISPKDPKVQATTSHRINFTTEHNLFQNGALQIKMPVNLILPPVGSTVVISPTDTSMTAKVGTVMNGQMIAIDNLFLGSDKIPVAPYTFDFWIEGSQNQNSAKDAGPWSIISYMKIQGVNYVVDGGQSLTSFVAEVGKIVASGPIKVTNDITSGINSIYSLTFIPNGTIEIGGTIVVKVPQEIVLNSSAVSSVGSCTDGFSCSVIGQTITYTASKVVPSQAPFVLNIGGAVNPRTTAQTGQFNLDTFDSKGNQIDSGYNQGTKMTQPNTIKSFNVESGSQFNGVQTNFTFSFQTDYPLKNGDILSFTLPQDIQPPTTAIPSCIAGGVNLLTASCQASGKTFHISLDSIAQPTGVYYWTIEGVKNPVSTQPSGSLTNISITDAAGNMALQYDGVTKPIQTSQEGTIKVANITQTNKESEQWNPYQIKFTPLNAIPTTGAIQLTWPPQVNINANQTNCFVQTNKVFNNTCTFNADGRYIIIRGAFAEVGLDGWSQPVTISLNDVQNPSTNKIGTGFGIRTYADPNIQYNIDQLPNTVLIPLLNCMFPCRTCDANEPSVCTSCWLKDTDEIKAQYFNRINDNGGVCESSCRDGTTSDGDPNKVCVQCDPSCAKCLDLGVVGDKRRCIQCSQTFPYRIDGQDTCMTKCTDGFYESVPGTTCSLCSSPCSTCVTTASTCTKCGVDPFLPLLFTKQGQPPQCLNVCPSGYTDVSGRCEKCNDPCATCSGTVNNCLTCSGTNATKYVFNGVCYPECPAGTTETQTGPNCLACQSGCDKCDDKDQSICLRCSGGLLVHLGGCIAGCPKDYVSNKDKTACVPWSLDDLTRIYFPFLAAALIAILIVLFGMCKKKEKAFTKVSITQHTVTCILVAIAPLQLLACAAQAVLAYLYGVKIHFYLAAAVFATYCVINFAFEIMYDVQFNRTVSTSVTMELKAKYADQQKKKNNGEKLTSKEVTVAQITQSQEPNDRLFNQHRKDHGFQFCLISSLTFLISFKFNKMYYSHFYSFGMFKAKWSNANHYRKVHTWYSMIHMFLVDLFLIVIGIAGLISIDFMKNQLYITFIETVVLSVLDIILGGYELFKLKEYLVYTEPKKIGKARAKVSSGLVDDDEENPKKKRAGLSAFYEEFDENSRAEMIQGLIYKVQANKNLFLNNKLDELLDLFGDRRCKSMIELGTGWDKEEDPRKIITIPMSPTLLLEKYDGEYHFGPNDMYGGQDDNCYAEVIIKDPGIDTAVQGDQGQQDFNQALQRKQADFLDPVEEDDELMNRKSKGKRRGRKNKYYAQIDNEDDVDAADAVEPQVNEESEEEDNEALILEQQREEEALRQKVEEERLKQEQLKAQRKAALLEAEQKRRLAEEAEEKARLKAEEEEEALRVAQEQLEQERLQELENARILMKQEEQEEKLRRERLEKERKEELQKMSEANRIKYEEEEAKRLAELKKEEQRIALEAEEAEKKAKLVRDEEQRLKREAAEKLRAERDASELARIQEQLAYEERQRNEAKEAERLRLEQEELQRKKLKMEQEEKDRQLKLSQHEAEMHKQLAMEAELKKRKEEEEAAYKQRKADEEAAFRKSLLEQNESERARLMAEQELLRKQLEAEMEAARLMRDQEMEKLRKLREAEDEARKKQIEEEEQLRQARLAEEEQARLARIAAEEAARLAEQENRLSKLEAETEARRLQDEENRKKKNAEDQKREIKRLEELKGEEDKILKHKLTIEAEAKRLQEEKDRAKKDDLARKEKLILEEAAKLDRERLEEQKKAEVDKARLREQQKSEMDKIEKEAAELERKEIIRTERARLEQEKAEKDRINKDKAADLARQEKDRLAAEARAAPPRADSRLFQENAGNKTLANAGIQVAHEKVENRGNKEIAQKVPPSRSSTLEQENSRVEFGNDKNLKAFEAKEANLISIPDADKRNFNVQDVLGDWERDDKGNVIVVQDKAGNEVDRQGRPTNNRGYLINPRTGDIVEGLTGRHTIYFNVDDLDDRGELPAPFCVEKYNFNPHDLQGDLDFDFDHESQLPIPRLLQTKQGFFVDKKGRRINKHGWLVNQNGHVVDKLGRTRFDRRQLEDGDLQRLYNYNGKRFDIKDVIGVFEKNKQTGDIHTIASKDGKFLEDNFGRRVNEKGYLIDNEGNIIDKEGRKIWNCKDLKNGDFIKIFQFTKFNINNVIGDFEMSPLTDPILEKDANGNFIDRKGRLVNARGYLIDNDGNIIDKYGKKMFDKSILSADGELPKVFRINLLKSDSSSSLSELMREIEKNQPSEFDEETKSNGQPPRPRQQNMQIAQEEGDGDTSVDSLMEDTPANYNVANQRFEEHYDDYEPGQTNDQRPQQQQRRQRVAQQTTQQPEYYGNPDLPKVKRKKKKKANKPKPQMLEYLMPTKREVNMADAYGGNAKGQFRRPGVKYDKERLMNRIKTPANIPGGRAQLEALANTVAGFHQQKAMASIPENLSARGASRPPIVRRNEFINDYDRSNRSYDEGNLNNSVQHAPNDMLGSKRKLNQNTVGNRSKSNLPRGQKKANNTGNFNEMDFEKVLGKDIDQFLEDSEWDIESYEKMSQFSRGSERNRSQDHKLKAMEKVYLQRVEKDQDDAMFASGPKTHVTGKNSNTTGPTTLGGTRKKYAPREFQDRFTNDAPFIARGQAPLEFETAIQAKPEKSNSRSPPRTGALRGAIADEANRVSKQVLQPPRK